MSLLLQALQKAAKNRDGNEGEEASLSSGSGEASLALEPLAEPQLRNDDESVPAETTSPASREHAASLMRANETPSYSALDWVNDHHMLSFLAAAALFAIFYGLYVYLQVSSPGAFQSAPPAVNSPLQNAALAPPPIPVSEPTRISGLPDAGIAANTPDGAQAPGTGLQQDASVSAVDVGNTGASGSESIGAPSVKPAAQRRRTAAPIRTPIRRVAAVIDSDGVEVIEIPSSPSVSAFREGQGAAGSKIAVQRQNAALTQIDPILLMAYEALQHGDYVKAGALYNQVLTGDSSNIDALLGLAAISWKQGRTNVASQYYGRVLELDPRNTHAQAGLIAILGNADPIAAESKLKQLIGRDPSGFLFFTLGNLYAEQSQWTRAQQAYFQAYQFQPDSPDYAFNLAVGLEHLGQTRPALEYYRKALDLSFVKGRANFDQGLAIERVGQLSARVK